MHFVSRDVAQKVIDACPGVHWRLLFALSRYGGLRCPSESLLLTWADVDWSTDRLRVTSPKTEAYAGKASRWLPIFHELRKHLQDAFDHADEGAVHVITRYRDAGQNLRTQLERIILRAGVTPWPKPFHNLRSTRQTELCETFPAHVVCQWLGNSRSVAEAHYLQVTDAHFAKASQAVAVDEVAENPAHSKELQLETAHNPAQHTAETQRYDKKLSRSSNEKRPVLPSVFVSYDTLPDTELTPWGFEPQYSP